MMITVHRCAACTHLYIRNSLKRGFFAGMQDDMLLATTTANEALSFAAALRLPSCSQEQRRAAVNDLLQGMKLQHCADTLVSAAAVSGSKGLAELVASLCHRSTRPVQAAQRNNSL
jgi:ABC-type multidrug transport system ATPase subunit